MKTRLRTVLFSTVQLVLLSALAVSTQGASPSPAGLSLQAAAAAPGPDSLLESGIEPISQIGGEISSMVLAGSYLYVGVGPRIAVWDVSNPAQPRLVGQSDVLSGTVGAMAVTEGYLYVGAGVFRGGFHVLDVTNPIKPVQVGFLDLPGYEPVLSIAVRGNYAYLCRSTTLDVTDVSNPANPVRVADYENGRTIYSVEIVGQYAYLGTDGLDILDLSYAPGWQLVGHATGGEGYDVAVSAGHAYVAEAHGMRVLDISDPTDPTQAGWFSTLSQRAYGVAVTGDHAYLAAAYDLLVIDVADPSQPIEVGHFDTLESARAVALQGNRAYVADGVQWVRIADITDPLNPTEAGAFRTPAPTFALGLAVTGHHAYVADGDQGLCVLDIANPARPAELACSGTGSARDVVVRGDLAYVAAEWAGLEIFDVSDPRAPTLVGRYNTDYARGIEVVGNYVYIADKDGGLRIIDAEDPTNPAEVGSYPAMAWEVSVSGSYAYLATRSDYVDIVSVADPEQPTRVSVHPIIGDSVDVTVVAGFAYIVDANIFRIVNVSNPHQPYELGSCYLEDGASEADIAVSGDYAFVVALGHLHVVDVADRAHPSLLTVHESLGWSFAVATADQYVFSADDYGGMAVYWFSPASTASIPVGGGSLVSAVDQTSYVFPSGTFSDTVTVTHAPRFPGSIASPGQLTGIDHVYEVSAVYESTGQPAQPLPGRTYSVTIQYTDAQLGTPAEHTLGLYAWDGSEWLLEPSSQVNPSSNTITATPGHLSTWAVLGETHLTYLPCVVSDH